MANLRCSDHEHLFVDFLRAYLKPVQNKVTLVMAVPQVNFAFLQEKVKVLNKIAGEGKALVRSPLRGTAHTLPITHASLPIIGQCVHAAVCVPGSLDRGGGWCSPT